MNPTRRGLRAGGGFTIVELVVVLGVFGVLVGLLLPAVQSARESARRSLCSKNLGQVTLATLAFESSRGGFPPSISAGRPYRNKDPMFATFSPQCMILPYMEQLDLYNSINFALASYSSLVQGANGTAADRTVASFLCPSDPQARSASPAPNSYRACTGVGGATLSPDGYGAILDGIFLPAYTLHGGLYASSVLPLSEVRDGLSNTLAYSEKPIGSSSVAQGSAFRDWYSRIVDETTLTPDQWSLACSHLVAPDLQLGAGSTWIMPGAIYTHFWAANPPNSSIPDCGTPAIFSGLGIFTARSYHPQGVNASMADGSVRWFSSTTQTNVWRGLATRAGGEIP